MSPPPTTNSGTWYMVGIAWRAASPTMCSRLGCLEVDVQLDFGGLLHRQAGGLFTLENATRAGEAGRASDNAAAHSITSSARPSSGSGTVRPPRMITAAPATATSTKTDLTGTGQIVAQAYRCGRR